MEAKKVYLHYEGSPEFTHVAKIIASSTAEELAVEFTRAYNAKHGTKVSLDPETVHLLNGKRRIPKSKILLGLVKDRSDIFVEHDLSSYGGSALHFEHTFSSNGREKDETNVQRHTETTSQKMSAFEMFENSGLLPVMQRETGSDQVSTDSGMALEAVLESAAKRLCGPAKDWDKPFIRGVIVYALKAQQIKKNKIAGNTFRKVLEVQPDNKICLRGLGSMALAKRKYSEAVSWLERGVAKYPLDALFRARSGDAYSGLGKYKEALREYDLALGLIGEQVLVGGAGVDKLVSSSRSMDLDGEDCLLDSMINFDLRAVDDPFAGDNLGPVTAESLKASLKSSAAVLGKMGEGGLPNANLSDASLDSSKQQLSAAGNRNPSLNSTISIPISMPLLSFADDLLLVSLSSGTQSHAQTTGSVIIPAHLPFDKKKVNIVAFTSRARNSQKHVPHSNGKAVQLADGF